MFKSRYINFKEVVSLGEWRIKTYTISKNETFNAHAAYSNAVGNLPDWLTQMNSFAPGHENMAFLVVHEGTEGVFSLINTWVGDNMLQTHIFLSMHDDPETFTKISGDGISACVWELEVIYHEQKAWIEHILKKSGSPDDYQSYLNDTFSIIL